MPETNEDDTESRIDRDVTIDLPTVTVEFALPSPAPGVPDFVVEYDFDLKEVLEGEGVEVIEATDTGLVVELENGETEHVDLRELEESLSKND